MTDAPDTAPAPNRGQPTTSAAPTVCPTKTPEPHELGEFPMTCYRCHIEADS